MVDTLLSDELSLSQLVWEELLAKLESRQTRLDACHPEVWVSQYEKLYAILSRKRRQQGVPQSGVFYTPEPIAAYLVQQTLEKTLDAQAKSIQNRLEILEEVLEQIRTLTVMDPSCGTGVFLIAALKTFHRFYQKLPIPQERRVQELQNVLASQVLGIDLDPVSVKVAQLRLQHWFRELTGQTFQGQLNVLAGNTLLPNTVAKFPVKQFSFIVGNPPYVSEVRGQRENFRVLKESGIYYKPKMDLCDAFLAWSLQYVQLNGYVAYVLPEYWTQRSSTKALRVQLLQAGTIQEFWRFQKAGVFKNAPSHHTSLLIWKKQENQNQEIMEGSVDIGEVNAIDMLSASQLKPAVYRLEKSSEKLLFGDKRAIDILKTLNQQPALFQPDEIQQGIILPQGRLDTKIQLKASLAVPGVFLLTDDEVALLNLNEAERSLLRPFFLPVNFQPFQGFVKQKPNYWLIYTNLENRRKLEREPHCFPNLLKHLSDCAIVNTSSQAPYGLHRSRQTVWFEDPLKILSSRQVKRPSFAVVQHSAYVGEGFYSIRSRTVQPHAAVAILNSTLAHFWFHQQKRKGERLQIDKDVLSAFPQPLNAEPSLMIKLSEIGNMLQSDPPWEQSRELYRHIDNLVYQLYGMSPEEGIWVQQQVS